MSVPHLLVSVRSVAEALVALDAGADLIDVKEPDRGPLGRSDIEVIRDIAALVRERAPDTPVSAAWGELRDLSAREIPELPAVDFVKVGLAGAGIEWRDDLDRMREELRPRSGTFGPRWIAVAYVDRAAANSPAVSDVLDYGIESDCAGLLLDTYAKGGGALTKFLDGPALTDLADRAHDAELFLACAGRLDATHLPNVLSAGPDIIAVRSAACRDGDRLGPVDGDAIRGLKSAIHKLASR